MCKCELHIVEKTLPSKGNQVMSILHVDLKIPGGTYKHEPLLRTTTFVGYVPSNPSSALKC